MVRFVVIDASLQAEARQHRSRLDIAMAQRLWSSSSSAMFYGTLSFHLAPGDAAVADGGYAIVRAECVVQRERSLYAYPSARPA